MRTPWSGTGYAASNFIVPPRAHVLLVEDDPLSVLNTERSLRKSDDVHSVTVAVDGRDALDRLRSGAFAGVRVVILTDLSMPRMSGLELVSAMRAEPALCHMPVVILTSSQAEQDIVKAYDLHANAYISKPVDLEQFLQVVRAIENFWLEIVTLPPEDKT